MSTLASCPSPRRLGSSRRRRGRALRNGGASSRGSRRTRWGRTTRAARATRTTATTTAARGSGTALPGSSREGRQRSLRQGPGLRRPLARDQPRRPAGYRLHAQEGHVPPARACPLPARVSRVGATRADPYSPYRPGRAGPGLERSASREALTSRRSLHTSQPSRPHLHRPFHDALPSVLSLPALPVRSHHDRPSLAPLSKQPRPSPVFPPALARIPSPSYDTATSILMSSFPPLAWGERKSGKVMLSCPRARLQTAPARTRKRIRTARRSLCPRAAGRRRGRRRTRPAGRLSWPRRRRRRRPGRPNPRAWCTSSRRGRGPLPRARQLAQRPARWGEQRRPSWARPQWRRGEAIARRCCAGRP